MKKIVEKLSVKSIIGKMSVKSMARLTLVLLGIILLQVTPVKALDLTNSVVNKKGICSWYYASSNAEQRDVSVLKKTGATWFYNWGDTREAAIEGQANGMEYVPMVWGAGSVSQTEIANLIEGKEAGLYKNLLTFNEPDLSSQANMTVDEAINLWPQLMETGLRLGSPAGAAAESVWVEEFMVKAKELGYRVDFLTLHIYQDFTHPGSVESLRQALERLYNKYQIPIWITEIGAINVEPLWGGYKLYGPLTHEASVTYIKEVGEMLESLDYVERYAWFVDYSSDITGTAYTRLLDIATGELTVEGQAYLAIKPVEEAETTAQMTTTAPQITTKPDVETLQTTSNIKKPARAKLKSVKKYKKRRIKVRIKKVKGRTGYRVQISTSRKFKKKSTKNYYIKKETLTSKMLKKNTKYYVRVKAYKVVNGNKVYSNKWSKIKKVRTSK